MGRDSSIMRCSPFCERQESRFFSFLLKRLLRTAVRVSATTLTFYLTRTPSASYVLVSDSRPPSLAPLGFSLAVRFVLEGIHPSLVYCFGYLHL
ncbi:hypothetical protein DEO72_LG3g1495 [Vigna unguiculata]|uniref:Uncharacterized protein n=1 Tax=Vigna unguiculata TaxID=3917 RepID=A0A4D6LFH3_VIGUN|nr:hypothetical protein DEO72_LG3g1495 [Vigna unguiculata]